MLTQLTLPQVSTLTAAELLDGSWTSEAALLVMPGGADLPYCNRLNSRGNTIIQGTVSCKYNDHSCSILLALLSLKVAVFNEAYSSLLAQLWLLVPCRIRSLRWLLSRAVRRRLLCLLASAV
jgi:hypothetical protein